MISRSGSGSFTSRAAAQKSNSAFANHCLTKSRNTTSGCFIDHATILVSRIGDPTKNILRFFEFLSCDDEHVEREAQTAQRSAQFDVFLDRVRSEEHTSELQSLRHLVC